MAEMTVWQIFKAFFQRIVWYVKGQLLFARLQGEGREAKENAEQAVARVIDETGIAPDCVSAQILRGGRTILVKHNAAWEAFVHNSYSEAADRAISWIKFQGDKIKTGDVSKLNRKQRRQFRSLSRKG